MVAVGARWGAAVGSGAAGDVSLLLAGTSAAGVGARWRAAVGSGPEVVMLMLRVAGLSAVECPEPDGRCSVTASGVLAVVGLALLLHLAFDFF